MPYRLIARGNSRPTVNGQVRGVRPNDSIIVNDEEKERLMRGLYRNKFVVAGYIPPNPSKSKEVSEESKEVFEESKEVFEESKEVFEESKEVSEESESTMISKLEEKKLPNPGLDQGTHWATVRSHVQDLGDQVPIPFDMIRAIQIKFGHYKPVVEECNKLLALEED